MAKETSRNREVIGEHRQTGPNSRRLKPANICIYCDAVEPEVTLTDEHIIPFSLGGRIILPKASCLKCADATKRVEGYAARQIFQDVRIEHGFPTRNPKDRPTHLPMAESIQNEIFRLVPAKEYPGSLILINMEPAGIIVGRPVDAKIRGVPFVRPITDMSRVRNLKAKGLPTKILRKIDPESIARLMAKIGLGLVVSSIGMEGFEPTIREVILKPGANTFHWVGGTSQDLLEIAPEQGSTHWAEVFHCDIEGVPFVFAQIQLFSYLNAPIYTVVVGRLTEIGLDSLSAQRVQS